MRNEPFPHLLPGAGIRANLQQIEAVGCCDALGAAIERAGELTAEGTLIIRNIPLSPEAWTEFAQFLQFAHRGKNAFEGREREWWAKMSAHALRLSGTLTYLSWAMEGGPEPAAIGKDALSSAIILTRDYFWPHARACLRQIGLTERHTNARRVLRWLMANHKTEVSREEVRREALSQRLDADGTTALLTSLCRSGWLREKTSPSGSQGGKPPRRWSVNPKLFNTPTAETALTAQTPQEGEVSAVSAVSATPSVDMPAGSNGSGIPSFLQVANRKVPLDRQCLLGPGGEGDTLDDLS